MYEVFLDSFHLCHVCRFLGYIMCVENNKYRAVDPNQLYPVLNCNWIEMWKIINIFKFVRRDKSVN